VRSSRLYDWPGAIVSGVPEIDQTADALTLALAAELKAERAATGVTQESIAAAAGISTRQIIRILKGERPANYSQMLAICLALNLTMEELNARALARMRKQAAGQ
jgi:transcriptional regulator with XRE-family HTH domain